MPGAPSGVLAPGRDARRAPSGVLSSIVAMPGAPSGGLAPMLAFVDRHEKSIEHENRRSSRSAFATRAVTKVFRTWVRSTRTHRSWWTELGDRVGGVQRSPVTWTARGVLGAE